MNFSENLKLLMGISNMSNSYLAKSAKIDPSLVSRFKSGERVPHAGSTEIKNIAAAFANIENDKINELFSYFNTNDKNELEILIYNFFNNSNLKINKNVSDKKKILLTRYSEKLDKCMTLLELSNIELAKKLDIDSSLVSRYRNGLRSMYSNNNIIEKISKYLCKVAAKSNKLYDLYKMTTIKTQFNKDKMSQFLTVWFKSNEKLSKDISIENSLIKLSEYNNEKIETDGIDKVKIKTNATFVGIEGLNEATLYFLNGVLSKDPTTIHFYTSEESITMFENKEYKKKWFNIMHALIEKGNKIIIYNDIEYSVEQMIDTIVEFLPLYYTGQIECRYITKTQKQKFEVNFYLAENIGFLYSSGVINSKEYIEHLVSFDEERTKIYTKQFNSLSSLSYPLLLIKDTSDQSKYIKLYKEYNDIKDESIGLLSSPFIGTININLLNRILERNNITGVKKNKIINFYNLRKEGFRRMIENQKITDYLITDAKGVHLDLYNVYDDKTIYYTEEEYEEHIKYIKGLAKKYPNYNVKFVSKMPYNNIKILVKKNYGVIVSKEEKNSKISFLLVHNIFIESFINYISILENN